MGKATIKNNKYSEKQFEKDCKIFNRILIDAVEEFLEGYSGKKVYQVSQDVIPVVLIRMISLHFTEHFEQSQESVKGYLGFIEKQIQEVMTHCEAERSNCDVEYLNDLGATA